VSVMDALSRDILSLDGHDLSGRHRCEVCGILRWGCTPDGSLSNGGREFRDGESYQAQHVPSEDRLETSVQPLNKTRRSGGNKSRVLFSVPNVPLCPYEPATLLGSLLRLSTPQQSPSQTSTYQRELLPLPPLSVSASANISAVANW
jgi:hypothetical protein